MNEAQTAAGTSMSPEESFIDSCRFAQLVNTPEGPGILVGGLVFRLHEPIAVGDFALWLVKALRRQGEQSGLGGNFGIVGSNAA